MEELDLTNSHLHSLADVDLSPSLKVVDLTANRLPTLEPKLLSLTGLQKLSLRQNLLTDSSEVSKLQSAPVLQELVLHDNHLQQAPDLSSFLSLTRLELSYNEIRSLVPLSSLASLDLKEFFVANNKVTQIEGLAHLTCLQLLELGANRIKIIENLDTLKGLEQLWLGRNRIAVMESLDKLTNLQQLSLQSNRLTQIAGLQHCTALKELYLSHNGIKVLEGLETLVNLQVLDVANNHLTAVQGLEGLNQLKDLWLNDNQICTLDSLDAALTPVKASLTCLYLSGNPIATEPGYAEHVQALLPNLEQLDADVLAK